MAEIHQSSLDDEALQGWLEDLTSTTEIVKVMTKGGEAAMAERTPTLEEALEALKASQVRGVQIRYLRGQQEFLDTLMRGPGGIRLVRIEAQNGSLSELR